ncbi:MAG: tripartite tricarboxylate transporter substrate binding protein [Deltaproteobacteria bacterium]|nr:tripartite tricarboxylate transporter substrate binding protein [Deltaproteobacteria bacterium]
MPSFLPYPGADSTVFNPYSPSDETGLILNALQPFYRASNGRNLRIAPLPGRGGATAWGKLASSPGDGYTLAATNLANVILRSAASRPVFSLKDLRQVCILAEAPLVLWVPERSPFPDLESLLRSARAYPGQMILAGAGSSTLTHLATLRLNFLSGVKTTYLPYLGTSAAMQATLEGRAHAAWGYSLADFGRQMGMRPLATAAPARLNNLSAVPTFDELKIGLVESGLFGLAAPGDTPPDIIQQAAAVYQRVAANPEFQTSLRSIGFIPRTLILEDLKRRLEDETARLTRLSLDFPLEF